MDETLGLIADPARVDSNAIEDLTRRRTAEPTTPYNVIARTLLPSGRRIIASRVEAETRALLLATAVTEDRLRRRCSGAGC